MAEQKPDGLSRREFLKDAGIIVGGAAIAGAAACSPKTTTNTVTNTSTTTNTVGVAGPTTTVEITKYACPYSDGATFDSLDALKAHIEAQHKGISILEGELAWMGKALSDKIKACTIFTPKTKQHIVVVASKCTGCGLCYKYCLGGVFDMDATTGKAVVARLETCMECAVCAHICPADAIGFDYPSGGTGVELRYA